MIGAEVFIEPGQTVAEIDGWFRAMHATGLTLCRIFLFENYMRQLDGRWDFTLFDHAYRAAEKYGIKVWGNLFPATDFTDVGGFKFPRSAEHLQQIDDYIEHAVLHFKQFSSAAGWIPINEPGSRHLPNEEFTQAAFADWKSRQAVPSSTSRGYPAFDFSAERFLLEYNTWFLQWLVDEIHKFDPGSYIHVNNHAIFENVAEYDFPAWRDMLTSLGGSAHASWHYQYFARKQYAVAMSANCEILRSGAGSIPWLMTEIQGGNNTYSGHAPMCPTSAEIAQWLWIVLGSGGQGGIFWCLNPRATGFEAGEWALLNFQDEPSDRLSAAANVARVEAQEQAFLAGAHPVESGVTALYTRESLWIEKAMQTPGTRYDGRAVGGVMKSALSYFEAVGEFGVQCNLSAFDEYDFTRPDYTGQTMILAHQICLPSRSWQPLEDFVARGGKLIVDGLTGYYDENAHCIMKTGFPLEHLFGGTIREFKLIGHLFDLTLTDPKVTLPAHCWQGTLRTTTATPIGRVGDETVALRHSFGKGEVVWIPSLIGLGGRLSDYAPLSAWLTHEIQANLHAAPCRFASRQPGMLMKTLQSGEAYLTILVNKSPAPADIELIMKEPRHPVLLFADQQGEIQDRRITIAPEETVVIKWT